MREILVRSTPRSLERNGSRRVRLHVKTISFPTLRHFQAGSPNTDRRLFQSALATGASSPSLLAPFLSLPAPPQQFLDTTRLLPDQDTRGSRIGEHARKGKRGNFHTEPQLSGVLGIYRNLPLPKSVQDGGVDTSIDRIRFTLIHSRRVPPPCARMFKYVIRANITSFTLLFEKLTNSLRNVCANRFTDKSSASKE